MKILLIILLLILHSILSDCQNTIGLPDVTNYTKEDYNAGTRNGDIAQDNNGIVYFANNEGLLSFDGTYWKTFPLPNKTLARSVAVAKDNRIYVGGQNEMGYFSPDNNGVLKYTSLRYLLDKKFDSFKDVWNIILFNNDVFFRTQSTIYHYNQKSIKAYPAPSQWQYLALNNNRLIAHDLKKGLLVFAGGTWKTFITESELPAENAVTSIVSLTKDSSLITTLKAGIFILAGAKISKFHFPGLDPSVNDRIMNAIPVNNDWIAVGTHMAGCYIIDKKGAVIQNFSRKEGLQNNTVLSLFIDKNRNLWLGLDNGIDYMPYNSPIKHIIPDSKNESAGYTSIVFNNELYFGTSNGLYEVPVSSLTNLSYTKENFKLIPDTKGPAWRLSVCNGNLLLGHHEGALQIKNNAITPLVTRNTGYWTFFPVNNTTSPRMIAGGSYSGLNLFDYSNNTFTFKETLPGFNESVRFAATDNNNRIWIAQPYKGVYRINLTEKESNKIKLYTDKNGLPSSINNYVFKVKNHIIVATEKGIYEYNERLDSFEPSAYFKPFFKQTEIRYLQEDSKGNIWFIEGKKLGVIDFSGPKPLTIYFPELYGKMVKGFENIYAYNNNNVFVGSDKGFYHIDYEQYKNATTNIAVKIRLVKSIGNTDSVLYGGFGIANKSGFQNKFSTPEIAYAHNSVHAEYSAPLYQYQSSIKYSYRLQGFDIDWSGWSKKAEKDYTNLLPGDYIFEVKAKTNLGNISAISSYSFKILPPWYATVWAYIVYALILSFIIYLFYKRQKKLLVIQQTKHEEEQKQLQYLHQLEIDRAEKEIIALKNEKLQAEIKNKNSELASASMHLLQRGEVLGKIKEEVMHIKNAPDTENLSQDLKKVIRTLREDANTHKDWEQFAVHFDNVHSDFLRAVKEKYPKLTPHELKLCAYLRMNLSSKEIAQLMNISVRGVELSRYRLRKKLEIPTEINLFNFLLEFDSSKEGKDKFTMN